MRPMCVYDPADITTFSKCCPLGSTYSLIKRFPPADCDMTNIPGTCSLECTQPSACDGIRNRKKCTAPECAWIDDGSRGPGECVEFGNLVLAQVTTATPEPFDATTQVMSAGVTTTVCDGRNKNSCKDAVETCDWMKKEKTCVHIVSTVVPLTSKVDGADPIKMKSSSAHAAAAGLKISTMLIGVFLALWY